MVRLCDVDDGCGKSAPHQVEAKVDGVIYRADICDEHIAACQETMTLFGFQPVASEVGGKRRDVHVGASGKPFTTADARAWLIEQGLRNGAARGRVSAEHLQLYAEAH